MGKFGDTLRQEREFRGITLDAITRVTKISNRHLVALEQEHFEVLPGGVFNKSMVREYARVVGLDQEEWVGRYLSAHQSTKDADEDGWMRFAENASKARGDSGNHSPSHVRPCAETQQAIKSRHKSGAAGDIRSYDTRVRQKRRIDTEKNRRQHRDHWIRQVFAQSIYIKQR